MLSLHDVLPVSVFPVPVVIFVICDAGCIAYCHYLMMFVACTACLIVLLSLFDDGCGVHSRLYCPIVIN